MSDEPEVRLNSGQLVRINDGVVEVITPPPPAEHHFKMTVEHLTSGHLEAACGNYDGLIEFLKQLEQLDYRLASLERQVGEVPKITFDT